MFAGEPLSKVTDYGTDLSDSGGTQVDPGATGNTKGAYSELVASSAGLIRHLMIGIGVQSSQITSTALHLIDVAVGTAGSEQIILPDLFTATAVAKDLRQPRVMAFPCHVPPGSRLAARAQCNTIGVDRTFDMIIYGVN